MPDGLRPVPTGRPRKTSDVVARSPACRPLRELYEWAVEERVTSWEQVEERFLAAMSDFDAVLAGDCTGARQGGREERGRRHPERQG